MHPGAMLAIWSDIGREHETDYLHWLTREHTLERVSTPGFLGVRVFRAMREDVSRYFICYALESAGVVDSAPYVAKLNNPTPWSQRIMPLLRNFRRGGGPVRSRAGLGQAGFIAPLILDRACPPDVGELAAGLVQSDWITAVSILEIDRARTSVATREKSMRRQDELFAGLILVEGLSESAVADACGHLRQRRQDLDLSPKDPLPFYRQVFSLDKPS